MTKLIERKRQVDQIMEITYDLVRRIDRQDVFSEKLLWASFRKKIRRVLNGSTKVCQGKKLNA